MRSLAPRSDELPLKFELSLEERLTDRVIVSVALAPGDGAQCLGGVAVELFSRDRDSLSPRVLLPISGRLADPIVIRVELRAVRDIPPGCRVVGTVWWEDDQLVASCPADPCCSLDVHLRGRRCVSPMIERELTRLTPAERGRLAALFPWIDEPRPKRATAELDEPLDATDVVDDISEELGLDDENARWLRELLAEDDETV